MSKCASKRVNYIVPILNLIRNILYYMKEHMWVFNKNITTHPDVFKILVADRDILQKGIIHELHLLFQHKKDKWEVFRRIEDLKYGLALNGSNLHRCVLSKSVKDTTTSFEDPFMTEEIVVNSKQLQVLHSIHRRMNHIQEKLDKLAKCYDVDISVFYGAEQDYKDKVNKEMYRAPLQ